MPTKSGSKQELLQTIEELKLRLERAETDAATAAEALRESEARLRLALKAARMVAWEHDVATNEVGIFEDSHQVLALPSGKRLTNSDHGQSLIHPDDVEKHRALVTEAIQNAGSYTSAYREVRDGEVSWLEERALAVADESGKTIRLVGVTQNITERKRAEQELVRTRNMLMEGQKIAHLGTFEYVAATRTTEWSEEEYRIYGLDPAGPSPAYDVMLTKCIHPDDAALLHETFTKAMQSRSIFELEHRIVRPDGSVRWVHDRAYPYFDDKGNLLR
jgi:PAS domain-containing protein